MLDIHKLIPQIGIMRLLNEVQVNRILKGYIIVPKNQIGKKLGFFSENSLVNMKSQLYNLISSYDQVNYLFLEAQIEINISKLGKTESSFNYVRLSNIQLIRSRQEKQNVIDEIQEQAQKLAAPKGYRNSKKSIFVSSSSISSKVSRLSTKYFRNSFVQDEKRLLEIQDLNTPQTTLYDNEDEDYFEEIEENLEDEDDKEKEENNQESNTQLENLIIKRQSKQTLISNEWEQTQVQSYNNEKQNEKINTYQNIAYEKERVKPSLQEHSQSRFQSNSNIFCHEEFINQQKKLQKDLSYYTNTNQQEENTNRYEQESKVFEMSIEATDRHLFSSQHKQAKQDLQFNGSNSPQKNMTQTTTNDYILSQVSQQKYLQQSSIDNNDFMKESVKISHLLNDKRAKQKQKKKKRNDLSSNQQSYAEVKKSESKKQNIASSVNSTRTVQYQRKQEIIGSVTTKQKNKFLEVIKVTGLASLIILITVTAVLFSQTLKLFQEELSHFDDIPYAVSIRADYSLIIKNNELQILLNQNTFGFSQSQQEQVNSLYKDTVDDNLDKFNHYKDMTFQYYRDTKSSGYKDYMLNTSLVLKNYSQMLFYKQKKGYTNQTFFLPYAFLYIQENLFYYMKYGLDDEISYNNVQQNFIAMFAQYDVMQTIVVNQAYSLCDTVTNLLYVSLVTILTISLMFILIIFPIYSSVQAQRESILKLNSTFDPSKFENLINQLSRLIINGNIMSQQRKSGKNTSALNFSQSKIRSYGNNQKKKMISSTTNLKRYNILLIIAGIFAFILLAIYPVVNLIVIKNFIDDAKYNINEISILYSVRAQLTSNYAANYMAMSGSLIPGPLDSVKYKRVQSLAKSNESKLQQILSIFNDFSQPRYDDSYYKGFFLKILKGNICDAFIEYPQFVQPQYQLDDQKCRTICNGILEQGLYVALQYVFKNFEQALPFFDKTSVDEFISNMRLWVQNMDFFEFNQLYLMMINVIESERVFMQMVTSNYFSYITKVTYALFFYSLICLLLVFFFCWVRYFRFLSNSILSARKVLSVVPIGYLMDNPYIMSYLEKQLNKK